MKISQIRIYVYFVFEFLKKVRERERKSIEKNEWQEIVVTRWHTQKWESINCNLYCNLGTTVIVIRAASGAIERKRNEEKEGARECHR